MRCSSNSWVTTKTSVGRTLQPHSSCFCAACFRIFGEDSCVNTWLQAERLRFSRTTFRRRAARCRAADSNRRSITDTACARSRTTGASSSPWARRCSVRGEQADRVQRLPQVVAGRGNESRLCLGGWLLGSVLLGHQRAGGILDTLLQCERVRLQARRHFVESFIQRPELATPFRRQWRDVLATTQFRHGRREAPNRVNHAVTDTERKRNRNRQRRRSEGEPDQKQLALMHLRRRA